MLLSSTRQEEVKGGLAILRRRALINFNLNDLQCAVHRLQRRYTPFPPLAHLQALVIFVNTQETTSTCMLIRG